MICKILLVPVDILEKDFLNWCKSNYGIDGFKLSKISLHNLQQKIMQLEDYHDRWAYYREFIDTVQSLKHQKRTGMPDFVLFNNKTILLCEFKSKGDNLSLEQIYWFEKNKHLPLAIAIAFNDKQNKQDDKGDELLEV